MAPSPRLSYHLAVNNGARNKGYGRQRIREWIFLIIAFFASSAACGQKKTFLVNGEENSGKNFDSRGAFHTHVRAEN
jgi:hypothetical protein